MFVTALLLSRNPYGWLEDKTREQVMGLTVGDSPRLGQTESCSSETFLETPSPSGSGLDKAFKTPRPGPEV